MTKTTLKQLRDKIDKIDNDIIKKISQRQALSIRIAKLKSKLDKPILDKDREQALMRRYKKLSATYRMQEDFIQKLFKSIIANSKKLQKRHP